MQVTPLVLMQLEKIAAAGIVMIPTPEVPTHFVFSRDGCVVLVERRGEGFGSVGSPGQLTEKGGFAALVERDGAAWFVAKGGGVEGGFWGGCCCAASVCRPEDGIAIAGRHPDAFGAACPISAWVDGWRWF